MSWSERLGKKWSFRL